jgi:hypothetical protein
LVDNIKGLAEFKNAKPMTSNKNLTQSQQQTMKKDFKNDISRTTEKDTTALKIERQNSSPPPEARIKIDRQLEQANGFER